MKLFLIASLMTGPLQYEDRMVTEEPQLDIQTDCQKWDGDQPTKCELALAQGLFTYQQALEGCALVNKSLEYENEKLKDLILNQPEPEEPNNFTLFGLPKWATGLLIGTAAAGALAGGIAIGSAL